MEIYKTKYVVRSFEEQTMTLTSTWLRTTFEMNDDEFKEEMNALTDLVFQYKAIFLLSVLNDLRFSIAPDMQAWLVKNITPKFIEAKLRKQAIIVPKDIFVMVSMQQTIEDVESEKHEHQTKFFVDIQSAKNWFAN
jgi:hypothetical protein